MTSLKRILLVEDNPKDIELTLNALQENHLANEVIIARDGVEAMDYLHGRGKFTSRPADPPVVILLDLKMPRMNGLETLAAIKKDPAFKIIPVVMLTSSREEQDLVKSYQLGVNAYVVKPVDFQQFLTAIKTLGYFWAVVNELPPQKETATVSKQAIPENPT